MRINLTGLLSGQEKNVPFRFEVDVSDLDFNSVNGFTAPVIAEGRVEDHAGALSVKGRLTGSMECTCARCLKVFRRDLDYPISAYLAEELQDEDSEDTYLIEENSADLDEIALTTLVLDMEQRFFCREECKGLCPKCGKDLNEGPCNCREDPDPRLAVLGQLLENQD